MTACVTHSGGPSGTTAMRRVYAGLGMVPTRLERDGGYDSLARRRLPHSVPTTRITMATTMIRVAMTWICGGISTFAESKISRGNVDTLPAIDDVMM